ncbi:MAG TPA: GNAT family N-acetyltransferase [Kofleriaceae bacterium]|nr:GNAT family N-acetyltransferase [Kofleriaceae bacterium]
MLLGRSFLASWLAGQPTPDLGFSDPAGFLVGAEDVVRLRLEQLEADPELAPWLLRAVVMRDERIAAGFIGFHSRPDDHGVVEIGYEVLPAFRRRGYASEAVTALIAWATREGARAVRACVSPDNAASRALVARQHFVLVGEQLDAEDGRELVFEKACVTLDR